MFLKLCPKKHWQCPSTTCTPPTSLQPLVGTIVARRHGTHHMSFFFAFVSSMNPRIQSARHTYAASIFLQSHIVHLHPFVVCVQVYAHEDAWKLDSISISSILARFDCTITYFLLLPNCAITSRSRSYSAISQHCIVQILVLQTRGGSPQARSQAR